MHALEVLIEQWTFKVNVLADQTSPFLEPSRSPCENAFPILIATQKAFRHKEIPLLLSHLWFRTCFPKNIVSVYKLMMPLQNCLVILIALQLEKPSQAIE
jgi:hypothetical protein